MPSLANSPALFNLARKCKGCPDTLCKGCHETGQKPGLPGTPTDAAKAPQDGCDQSAMSSRTPPTHTSPSADWLRSGVLMLLDSSPVAMNRGGQPGVFSFQRPPTRDSWEPARNNQRFL